MTAIAARVEGISLQEDAYVGNCVGSVGVREESFDVMMKCVIRLREFLDQWMAYRYNGKCLLSREVSTELI